MDPFTTALERIRNEVECVHPLSPHVADHHYEARRLVLDYIAVLLGSNPPDNTTSTSSSP